jgi:Protein of unknown function (DUF4446)
MLALAIVALILAVVAMAVSLTTARAISANRRGHDVESLPTDVQGLRVEVAALKAEAGHSLRHLAVVRYDAFGDMGGHLSWSVALLDDSGDGVVLTSIHGRQESRSYAKNVAGWKSEHQLSPEELEAVAGARG